MRLPISNRGVRSQVDSAVDAITGGRFVLGVGLGYRDEEFRAFGIAKKERVGRLVEGVEIIKQIWTEDNVTFKGKHFQIERLSVRPRPVQKPRPPIWMGAGSDVAIKRAATMADAWIGMGAATRTTLKRQAELYAQTRSEAGLPPATRLPIMLEAYVAPTREEAWRIGGGPIISKFKSYFTWGLSNTIPEATEALDAPIEELARDRFLIGDVEDAIREVKRHDEELGATDLLIRVQFPGITQRQVLDTLALIGERVISAFKKSVA
ncbi:MAG: LLM class flavin-dependent oxidoreductase [Chloroflexi bacterium]|nr:LLM class flavin-dependent oxidoreductase [Chloroflexota bacterium]